MIRLPLRPPWLRSWLVTALLVRSPRLNVIILGLRGLVVAKLPQCPAFRSVIRRAGERDRPDRRRGLGVDWPFRHRHAPGRGAAIMPSVPGVAHQEIDVDVVVMVAVAPRP